MNHDKLNEFLAIEVMGLHKGKTWTWRKFDDAYFDSSKYDPNLASDEQTNYILANHWNPRENIEQAMMCLDSLSPAGIKIMYPPMENSVFQCTLLFHNGNNHEPFFDSITRNGPTKEFAISLACACAAGYEE